jgi:predicted ATPase
VTSDAIETQLDVLESVGLVELYQTDPELEYLFRHVLIQEAAYASMVRYERRRLHHLVGEVLERRYDAGQRELAAVLALHFEQAGDQDRAVDYLVAAAEYALQRFANRDASTGICLLATGRSGREPHVTRKDPRAARQGSGRR